MAKAISLKILKLQYGGNSIGNDIRLEIEAAGEKFSSDQTIKHGSAFEYNQEVRQFRGVDSGFEISLKIRVTEKDFLFSDIGETSEIIPVDLNTLPQTFEFQVKVKEKNKLTLGKSTAIFSITFEAKEFNPIYPRPQVYINSSKKDYNRFDTEIANAVGEWNDEFLNQEYPPNFPLNPSLVKAMMYVESEMGYFKSKRKGAYPSYPDIMQVADPDNDAIYALKNIYNPNPGRKKMGTEYEVLNQQLKVLEYKEANGAKDTESIYWGVRYLYHIAQRNIPDGNSWRREWNNWIEIFADYNGGGDKDYRKKVLEIYDKGTINVKNSKSILWNAAKIFLFGVATYTSFVGFQYLDNLELPKQTANALSPTAVTDDYWISNYDLGEKIIKMHSKEDPEEEIEGIQVEKKYDSPLFATIIEGEKDWWEYFEIGEIKNNKIRWLDIDQVPTENSILSVVWLKLEGIENPILEVYAKTHMGNGNIYLYKVEDNNAKLFFTTFAASGYWTLGDPNENYKNYRYWSCRGMYAGGKLLSEYYDLNNDGISDLILTGANIITCDKDIGSTREGNVITKDIVVDKIPIKESYYLNPNAICVPDQNYIYICK